MRRALLLITLLTVFTFGCGLSLDHLQQKTALRYLDNLHGVRLKVLEGQMDAAAHEQAYLHALWQHDAKWLNCLIDHHHTRDVEGALLKLATALEQSWPDEALIAIDEAADALDEVARSDQPYWENIL